MRVEFAAAVAAQRNQGAGAHARLGDIGRDAPIEIADQGIGQRGQAADDAAAALATAMPGADLVEVMLEKTPGTFQQPDPALFVRDGGIGEQLAGEEVFGLHGGSGFHRAASIFRETA